jgi:hypothetical protein
MRVRLLAHLHLCLLDWLAACQTLGHSYMTVQLLGRGGLHLSED